MQWGCRTGGGATKLEAGRPSPRFSDFIFWLFNIVKHKSKGFWQEVNLTQRQVLLAIEDCGIIRSMDSLDNKKVNTIFS